MKIKKIVFIFIFVLVVLSINAYAKEDYPFDMTNLVQEFNNHEYVKKLNAAGNNVYLVSRTNRYTVRFNSDELTYTYDEEKKQLHTEIEDSTSSTDNLLIANALFIDTISVMQGKEAGALMAYAFDNCFYSNIAEEDGISLEYLQNAEGKATFSFKINPYIRIIVPQVSGSIQKSTYISEYNTLYEDANTFIYENDMMALKTIDDSGNLVIYIGEPKENTSRSKESVKTLINILVKDKSSKYFDKNVPDLNNNYNSEAIKVEANLDSIPFTETRALLLPHNMKYAKVTINKEKLSELAKNMSEEPEAQPGDATKIGNPKVPLIASVLVIGIVAIILLIGIIKRHHN